MKKIAYLMTMVLTLSLMSVSCSKDESDMTPQTQQTLQQQFPNWKNLTWVSTDGLTLQNSSELYPRLTISISGNMATVYKQVNSAGGVVGKYTKLDVSGNVATFSGVFEDYNGTGTTLTCSNVAISNSQVTLTCLGNTYVLKIN